MTVTIASGPTFDAKRESLLFERVARVWQLLPNPDRIEFGSETVQRLADVERSLIQAGSWVTGPSSLFEVLGLVLDEVRNCAVVRWLLDPLAPHRLGSSILSRFLEDIGRRWPQSEPPPFFPQPEEALLVVEEQRADTRADLLIYGPAWTIVVEAKMLAAEQDRQGHRLAQHWPGATYVFLTLTGREMTTAHDSPWIPYTWRDLLAHVKAACAAAAPARDEREREARAAIADYLSATRRLRA